MTFRIVAITVLLYIASMTQMALAGGHGANNAFGFALIVPEADVEKVEAVMSAHRKFMESTHSVNGDLETRLNSYSVVKLFQFVDFADPSKGMTGNYIYILSEHYETPTGLGMHLAAGNEWEGIGSMGEIMSKYGVAAGVGQKISAMNR